MKQNAKLIGEVDAGKDELAKEKAENATLKAELESTLKNMQFIVVDTILHAMAKLMGEFKKVEHDSWEPNQEIQTWEKRAAVLTKDDEEDSDKEDDELTSMVESPKQTEFGDSSKQTEPEVGAGDAVGDVGKQGLVEPIVNQEDITKDQIYVLFLLFVYI